MLDKKRMDEIKKTHNKAKKDFKNRCLMVIETLCGEDIISNDIDKLKSDIYQIAHVALGTCANEHKDWVNETEKLFNAFEKGGLI